jgi:DNA-binding phage protein
VSSPTADALALCAALREHIIRAGWSETARRTGIDRCALHRAFPEKRRGTMPAFVTVSLVAAALNLRLAVSAEAAH